MHSTHALTFSLERLGPEIEEAFARLFPPEDGKTPELMRWRFDQSPAGRGWIATARDPSAGNVIVGVVAGNAVEMVAADERLRAFQAVDLVVDPAYRGRGAFSGLGRTLLDGAATEGGVMVWGFPNDNAQHAWFNRFGWLRFGTAPFMIRPIRTGYFLRRIAPFLGRVDIRVAGGSGLEPELISRFGDEFDELWKEFSSDIGCAAARTSEWFNWRFVDRPGTSYRNVVLRAQDGRLDAFVSTCLLEKHEGKILYVMEALGRSGGGSALTRLLKSEIGRAADLGAEVALAWCPEHAPNRASYRGAGFLPFPDRLRPVRIHFGAKLLTDNVPEQVRDGSRWYVSYLDSDNV
jgi:GNAT superfamily N-acetyltransferase